MENLRINSKQDGPLYFEMSTNTGYVFLSRGDRPRRQICAGGRWRGPTVRATPETFEAVCRRWYRQFRSLKR